MFRFLSAALAVFLGRLVALICRLSGRAGTSLPGYIALKVDPLLLKKLTSGLNRIIVVTGTNGKTTTANLLARILRVQGYTVIHNSEGANMPAGIATALLRMWGKRKREAVVVLEVDEGSLSLVLQQVPADLVVVTNLLRDQLDRYHELEQLAVALKKALDQVPEAELLLNADDPLVTSLGRGRSRVYYFGVERTPYSLPTSREVLEGHICPDCRTPLEFNYYHYSHLGDYRCPFCGWRRPIPDFRAGQVSWGDKGSSFSVDYSGGRLTLTSPLPGMYNCYNLLAAVSAGLLWGADPRLIAEEVRVFRPGQGRIEEFVLAGKRGILLLVKNPAGLSEALRTVTRRNVGAYVLAINDLAADGRDVSWLWDADLEPLLSSRYSRVICSGLRAWDMAVCLKYNGMKPENIKVVPDRGASLRELVQEPAEEICILCTYTNLAVYRRLLQRMGAKHETAHCSPLSRTA
ncbi:MAG: MurT ligase domain-containing protein [Moorellaceae bacterium]